MQTHRQTDMQRERIHSLQAFLYNMYVFNEHSNSSINKKIHYNK